jgi:hypothetical protein
MPCNIWSEELMKTNDRQSRRTFRGSGNLPTDSDAQLTVYPAVSCALTMILHFSHGSTAPVVLGLLYEVPRSHPDTHTLGKSPLDEGSACRRDHYLTTHNTNKRQASMTPVGFEPTIPASKRPQAQALDRAATGIGGKKLYGHII